jgi:CRISPR/Cas system-associated protein Cas10 (large subunit of type III CRISPR-Cas system)
MEKYLYGASVQGIQGFIFETNKLQEIVGASDLIERFCSFGFIEKFADKNNFTIKAESVVRNAGGNIRILFSDREELTKIVQNFPKFVMEKAYGITLSQAVVAFDDGEYLDKKDELEYQLTKARNQASMPLDARFALMKQNPRTGKPAFELKNREYFDKGNWQKKDNREEARVNILLSKLKLNSIFEKFPLDMDKIANSNNKIAIIHADGNKMGLMLQQMNKDLKDKKDFEIQKVFKTFSTAITNSTNDAVKEAFEKVFQETFDEKDKFIKFRPIVIGGDDVTVVCDANKALEFTQAYLIAFERNTQKNFKEADLSQYAKKLTACAGISFVNKKFPFHYAYDLAEHLCSYAKEASNREASCLISHNIQSSFVEDYKTYIEQELTTKEGVKLLFAPYYTDKEPKIDTLVELHKLFSDSDIPLGKYREWLTELHKSQEYAGLFLERVDALMRAKVGSEKYEKLNSCLKQLDDRLQLNRLVVDGKTPMQDIMQLKSVIGRR